MPDHANSLRNNWKNALAVWEQASEKWRDTKAVEFARKYWSELETGISVFSHDLEQICQDIENSQKNIPGE